MTADTKPALAAPIPAQAAAHAPVLTPEQLIAVNTRRYATKQFDPARKIPAAQWAALEQALLYSASSSGLQPWRFLVVTDPTVKQTLLPSANNQRQIADASHLVVFLARTTLDATDIDRWVDRIGEVRGTSSEQLEAQRQRLTNNLVTSPKPGFNSHQQARQQVFIAVGQFITSAALLGLDTCTHGGFNATAFDTVFELDGSGYRSVVLVTVGYRAEGDANAHAPKVRFPLDQVVQYRSQVRPDVAAEPTAPRPVL